MDCVELNHPWFIYPRGFMSEYNDYSHFRNESIKMYKFIDSLPDKIEKNHLDEDILIPFIIGSPMEDALSKSNSREENLFQYTQLFPNYINNFIQCKKNKKFIQIIIISPDTIFNYESNKKPFFTIYGKYDFVCTNINEYIYTDSEIEIRINIFNCMIPCIELRTQIIKKYDTIINKNKSYDIGIMSYRQTDNDLEFIKNFYCCVEKLFNFITNLNFKIIINSWVSFKNLDGIAEKFNMFPKILELANKYNIIATEWEFVDELFYTKIISQYKFYNKNFHVCNINYAFDDMLKKLPVHVAKLNFDLNNLFVIDFNSPFDLKYYQNI